MHTAQAKEELEKLFNSGYKIVLYNLGRDKYFRLLASVKVDNIDVAEYMGFESTQAVYKWQRGESLPTVDNLYALSRLLHTPVDDILIGEKERDDDPSLSFYSLIFFCNFLYAVASGFIGTLPIATCP